MSHSVAIKTQFKNIKALREAFKDLGWTMKLESKIKTYYSDPVQNTVFDEIAINPNGYDVGLVFEKDGTISLKCDFYAPGNIAKTLGSEFTELKKKYVINVTEEEFGEVEIEQQFADGSFILVADDGL